MQRTGAGVRTCVMEVSSQGLWMGRVRGIPFHACLFTNLSPDHIGGVEHPDYAHYRACKKSLFTDYPLGLALCNADDAEAAFMMRGVTAPVRGFSVSDKPAVPGGVSPDWLAADIRPVQRDGVPGMAFTVTAPGGSRAYSTCPMRWGRWRCAGRASAFRSRRRRRRSRTRRYRDGLRPSRIPHSRASRISSTMRTTD